MNDKLKTALNKAETDIIEFTKTIQGYDKMPNIESLETFETEDPVMSYTSITSNTQSVKYNPSDQYKTSPSYSK